MDSRSMDPAVAEHSPAVGGMKDRVVWEVFAWAALVAGAFALSFGFDEPLPHYPPGAALWPRIIQAMMTAAAIVLLVSRFLPQTVIEEQAKAPEYLEEVPDDLAGVTWRTAAVFVVPLLWAYAMHKMGFLLVTPVFLVLFTWLMGVTRWRTLLGFGIGFYAVLVLVFYKLIFTPLPMGAGMFHTINAELLALLQ